MARKVTVATRFAGMNGMRNRYVDEEQEELVTLNHLGEFLHFP